MRDRAQVATQEIVRYVKNYGVIDSLIKISESTRTLGNKVFNVMAFRNADTTDPSRSLFYSTPNGATLFTAFMNYTPKNEGNPALGHVDIALGTLAFTDVVPLRHVASRSRPEALRSEYDLLGRDLHAVAHPVCLKIPSR